MNSKKLLIITFLILIGINSCNFEKKADKLNDKDCALERWLILYHDDYENKILFDNQNVLIDPYEEIKQLLLDGKVRLWSSNYIVDENLLSPHPNSIRDSIKIHGQPNYYNKYFDYKSQGDVPLKNSKGNDSIYTYPDSSMVYIYPSTKYNKVTFDKISEFRIKEILIYDSIKKKNIMKPSLIGFDVFTWTHNILFWVKIDELKMNMKKNKNWLNYIVNKKYNGFIYKQKSCKDPEYKWKKIYH